MKSQWLFCGNSDKFFMQVDVEVFPWKRYQRCLPLVDADGELLGFTFLASDAPDAFSRDFEGRVKLVDQQMKAGGK